MDQMESNFQQTQMLQPRLCFRNIDNIFFIWTYGENSFKKFMMEFNNFYANIKFTYVLSEASSYFLDFNVNLSNGKLQTSSLRKICWY